MASVQPWRLWPLLRKPLGRLYIRTSATWGQVQRDLTFGAAPTPVRLTLTGRAWTPTLTGHAWTPTLTGTAYTPTLTGAPS